MMVCSIFHTAIIINAKNWRKTVKLHFENLSSFLIAFQFPSPPPPLTHTNTYTHPPLPPLLNEHTF